MFGYTEIYSCYDQSKFNEIRTLLKSSNIKFHDSMKDSRSTGFSNRRALVGTLGENAAYQMVYKIAVKKEDAEKAKYIIRKGI